MTTALQIPWWSRGFVGRAITSRTGMQVSHPAVTAAMLLLLPLAVFLAFFPLDILDIGNIGWLLSGTDNGENALGAHAYWHDATAGASLQTTLLNAPEGISVLYTDSNPLLVLLVKPIATLLPAQAQFVGPVILFHLALQALVAWLLLRHRAPGPMALWAGVALLAFPPTLMHRYLHVNLMAHWTILTALLLFLDRDRSRKTLWWAALIAVTTMIHSYLLIMVAAICGSALLARFTAGDGREKLAVVGQFVGIVAMVAVLARWLGVAGQLSTDTFGHFRMPIDALWNPAIQRYGTAFPVTEAMDRAWFEGFQYLGLGALLLIATAVVVSHRRPAPTDQHADLARLRDLVPAMLTLTVLAVAQMPMPSFALALLDPVRASGRLFWPVGYVLIIVALLTVYRLPARAAGLTLVALIAVQAADLRGMAQVVRQEVGRSTATTFDATPDPRWNRLIAASRSVAFVVGDVRHDLEGFQEIAWRAIDAGRPVTAVYAARTSTQTLRRLEAQRAAFARGELVPGRLYIAPPDATIPVAQRARAMKIDGRTVIAPIAVD